MKPDRSAGDKGLDLNDLAGTVVSRLGFAHLDFRVPCDAGDHHIRVSQEGLRAIDHSEEDLIVHALGSRLHCLETAMTIRWSPKQVAMYEEYCHDPKAQWISGMVSSIAASDLEESPCDPSLVPQQLRRLALIGLCGTGRLHAARRLARNSLERLAETNEGFRLPNLEARDQILGRVDENWLTSLWLLGIDEFKGGFPLFWYSNSESSAKIGYLVAEKGSLRLDVGEGDLQRLSPSTRWSTSRWSLQEPVKRHRRPASFA